MTSDALPPPPPPRPRRRWPWVLLGLVALPVLGFVALSTLVGLRMRDASAAARRYCAAFPVGAVADGDALRRRGTAEGLQVRQWTREEGAGEVEACGGVMTATYCCTLTLAGGRVTAQRYARID